MRHVTGAFSITDDEDERPDFVVVWAEQAVLHVGVLSSPHGPGVCGLPCPGFFFRTTI